jgi:serine/threonine protein kinase
MNNRIGRYEIQAELGRGGFGRVFRAFDPTVGRLVAIKTLNASGEKEMLTRFRNEAAAAGRLHHTNIVIVYDFGEHDGSPFLVMELLDGEDVERIIANNRPLPLSKRLDVMVQSAAGLYHAHEKGIVHRDVKPANIMLLTNGTVKILDFGIALLTQATADRITPQGSMIGTLPYMAPEQFFGGGSSVMTDIFAYGVTCYKLLTGVHPFQSTELGAMMHSIANLQQAPIRTLNPDCPEALEQVINKLLAKSPESRYQSLEEVRFDLEPIILDLRKESVGELLVETRNLIAADRFETAQSVIRQVIEIDPGNRLARELRESIQRQLKDRAVRPRVTALVTAGRDRLAGRKFDEAIQNFESALRLDKSNPELHRLIEQARTAAERAKRADQLLEQARDALQRDDLTAAHNNITEAISTDPDHGQTDVLLGDVRKRIELRRREQHLRDALSHLKGLMLLQNFAEAIEAATRLQADYPDSSEARKLLEQALREQQAQARRDQVQAAIAQVRDLLKNRRLSEAVDWLAKLQKTFPEAHELRDLATYAAEELHAARQAEAIARATADTRRMLAAGKFDAALDMLQKQLAEDPSLHALRELMQNVASEKAQHQRNSALKEVIRKGTALSGKGRFSEALESLDVFVSAYGENPALIPLRKQAEEGLERQRRTAAARKLIQDAQGYLDQGQPDEATQVLKQGTVEFPGNPELAHLLGIAENNLREKQQEEALSRIIGEAESLARAKRFDSALQVIADGQRKYARAERLLRCREAILASNVAHERERTRRESIERAQSLREQATPVPPGKIRDADPERPKPEPRMAERPRAESETPVAPVASSLHPLPAENTGYSTRMFLAGGIGAATLGAGIALFHVWPSQKPISIPMVPVEVRSDPAGASVRIDVRSCVTPNCRFELKPGQYTVEAQLSGYQPVLQPLKLSAGTGSRVLDLTLQPLPAPPPEKKDSSAGTGTLLIHTGVPGALVYIDGVARSRTDQAGALTLSLPARTHDVRVEKTGYAKTVARNVVIATGHQQSLNFTLSAEPSRLELRGAPAGVEVRADGRMLGKTDGLATFVFPGNLSAGNPVLQFSIGPASRSIHQRAEAGQTLRLNWKDVAPAAPPQGNHEAADALEWDRLQTSSDIAQIRTYLANHPNGPHAKDAASRLADVVWTAVDQNNIDAVRKFVKENPENPHSRVEARKILDQFDAEQQRLATERANVAQEKARQEQAKLEQSRQEQAKQEQRTLEQSRKQLVLNTLQQLDSALQRKRVSELKTIWPGVGSTFFESLRSGQVEMSLGAEDVQFPQGPDQAVAHCDLVTRTRTGSAPPKHHRGTLVLRNIGGTWTIESARFD